MPSVLYTRFERSHIETTSLYKPFTDLLNLILLGFLTRFGDGTVTRVTCRQGSSSVGLYVVVFPGKIIHVMLRNTDIKPPGYCQYFLALPAAVYRYFFPASNQGSWGTAFQVSVNCPRPGTRKKKTDCSSIEGRKKKGLYK